MLDICIYDIVHSASVGHMGKASVSGCRDWRFKPDFISMLSLCKTLNPHCFSRLSCEMSTIGEHPHEGCLFSAMNFSEEIALTN